MKHYLSLLILILSVFACAKAQDLTVRSFTSEPADLTARVQGKKDKNNEPCAAVKVLLAKSGAKFDGNIIGEPTFEASQYLVFMTKGSKRLDVMLEGFLPLTVSFPDYGIESLHSLETYKLVIVMPTVAANKPKLIVTSITKDATLYLNGEKLGIGSWEGELPAGDYTITARKLGYIAQSQTIHFTNEISVAVSIPELFAENIPTKATETTNKNRNTKQPDIAPKGKVDLPSFYLGANYQIGGLQGIGVNIGTYINKFNIEFDFVKGLSESETLYNRDVTEDCFSAMSYELRVGYGLPVGRNFRITPQVGANYSQISGKDTDTYSYAASAIVGVKADFNIVRIFGISLCPEFGIPVSEGKVFTSLANADSFIKGLGSGFNLRVGAYVCF